MKRGIRIALALLALILALGAAALIAAPFALERMVKTELKKRGVAEAEMEVGTPGPGSATVSQVRIGADEAFTADALRVEYSIPELARGRIERIRLVRPRLRVALTDSGDISFGSLDPLLRGSQSEPGEGGPQLGLPAPLEIVDGAVLLSTPEGEVTARLEGAVTLEPGAGPLQLAIEGPWVSAALELRLKQEGAVVSISGRVSEGRITHPHLSASFAGPFTAALGGETPAASAELKIADLHSPIIRIGTGPASGDLSAWYERGRVAGDLRVSSPGGQLEASLLGETPERLRGALAANGITVPELLSEAQLQASFDLDPSARSARLAEPALLQGRIAPEVLNTMPETLRPALADGSISLTADAGSQMAQGASGPSASGRLTIARQDLFELALDGSLSPTAVGSTATAQVRLTASDLALAGYRLRKLSLTAPVNVTIEDGRARVDLTGPAPLSIGTVDGGALRLSGLSVPLQAQEAPLFASGPDGSAFALTAGAAKAEGRFGQDREPFTFAWKEAGVEGRPGAMLSAEISGGQLALPRLGWAADGVSARLTADETRAEPPAIAVQIESLAETAKERRLAPVALEGTIFPTDAALRFDLSGRAADGQAKIRAKGSHDLTRGRGSATLTLDPLRFAPGGLQPALLVPALGDAIRDATGTLSAGGKIDWSDKGLMSDLEFTLERVGFLSPAGPVLGLNGTVRLDGLAPLSTPPGQRITIQAVQAAAPISDVRLQFGLREGRYLGLEEGRLTLAGGRVSIVPETIDLQASRKDTTLEVAEIQLPALFDLIGLDGLTGTGRLAGKIPVAWEAGDLAIENGELHSQEPGLLRYDPAQAPSALQGGGESVGLALAALKNFHYDRLTLKLDRELGGETLVGLHIAGKNPDFYGGYPVEFNLNLSGKLDQILIQGLAGYRLPETIQDQLEESNGGSTQSAP